MIAIVRYNAGNTRSVLNALHRLGTEAVVTDDPRELEQADKVILPGVGEAASAMAHLRERGIDNVLRHLQQPFLGICLGLQLMCRHSEEGDTECLGIFDHRVMRFPASGIVPHMGWNDLRSASGLLFGPETVGTDFYFVHSYFAELGTDTAAVSEYLVPFSAALQRDNFHAVQFHPEKSAEAGSALLQRFLQL